MSDGPKGGAGYPIRAVERVCDILDLLQVEPEGVSLAAVAAATELPKSSAYRYLLALEARRYAERDADTGLFRLGHAYRPQRARQMERFLESAQPLLAALRDKVNETVNIGVLEDSNVVHVAVEMAPIAKVRVVLLLFLFVVCCMCVGVCLLLLGMCWRPTTPTTKHPQKQKHKPNKGRRPRRRRHRARARRQGGGPPGRGRAA